MDFWVAARKRLTPEICVLLSHIPLTIMFHLIVTFFSSLFSLSEKLWKFHFFLFRAGSGLLSRRDSGNLLFFWGCRQNDLHHSHYWIQKIQDCCSKRDVPMWLGVGTENQQRCFGGSKVRRKWITGLGRSGRFWRAVGNEGDTERSHD